MKHVLPDLVIGTGGVIVTTGAMLAMDYAHQCSECVIELAAHSIDAPEEILNGSTSAPCGEPFQGFSFREGYRLRAR
jgi:hypothetical protein